MSAQDRARAIPHDGTARAGAVLTDPAATIPVTGSEGTMMYRRGSLGACYELCWAQTPYKHAGHYLGYSYPMWQWPSGPAWLVKSAKAWMRRLRKVGGWDQMTTAQRRGVAWRLAEHEAGVGARLTAVLKDHGIKWQPTRLWGNCTEQHEKWLKDLNSRRRLCPACNPGNQAGANPRTKEYRRNNRYLARPAA